MDNTQKDIAKSLRSIKEDMNYIAYAAITLATLKVLPQLIPSLEKVIENLIPYLPSLEKTI